ncbi:MAG: alpha/beta hydrolase [Ruminococcaceae bacterium]|nr:alpha/beta hydrolase [Oscillospiraceae bacterium]
MFHVKERKLKLPGLQMDYITFGKGPKPLIMIQGLNTNGIKGTGIPLAFMYRLFARSFKVYLFDRRDTIKDGITVRELANDVAAAMDSLNIKDAAVLGVSQGGMIAQYLAIDRPDLVNKMVLAVTLTKNNPTVVAAIERWIDMTQRNDISALVADMSNTMYSPAYVKRYTLLMPLLTILQKPKDPQKFIRLAKACLTCDTYQELDKIHCPVLVIGAAQDKVVGSTAYIEIAEKLGCELFVYEDLGHAAYEEAKNFNRKVYDFLK